MFWFEKAAAQEHLVAQFALGMEYFKGQGVPQDEKQAVFWIEKAATQSQDAVRAQRAVQVQASAQYMLGLMYDMGKGVAQDNKQAVFWWEKAAAQGDAQAKSRLAQVALKLCRRRSATELDDGVSPANVIALAVVAACRREVDAVILAMAPTMAGSSEFREAAEQKSIPEITRIVLEHRAAKRQTQEDQDSNEKKKPQSRAARPKP